MYYFLNRQRNINNVSVDDADTFLLERLKEMSIFDGDEAQLKLQAAIVSLPEKPAFGIYDEIF